MDDIETALKEHDKRYAEYLARNRKMGKGVKQGKIFRTPRADGYAYYEIIETNLRTKAPGEPELIHIKPAKGLSLDEYRDFVLGDGGWFLWTTIEPLVENEDAYSRL